MKRFSCSDDQLSRSSQLVQDLSSDGTSNDDGGQCKRIRLSRFLLLPNQCEMSRASSAQARRREQESSRLMSMLPLEIIGKCLSFMHTSKSRYALCSTCRDFNRLCNKQKMLRELDIEGDDSDTDGTRGIIIETDSKNAAFERLVPYARAGNLSALHMMGSIRCYCFDDVEGGVKIFRRAMSLGHVRSAYSLGLILRDSSEEEATSALEYAASKNFAPAIQELISAEEMKQKYGEPSAEQLKQHFDPPCLTRLLSKTFLEETDCLQSRSHCWNTQCGRWAYKLNSCEKSSVPGDEPDDGSLLCIDSIINDIHGFNSSIDEHNFEFNNPACSTPKVLRTSRMKMCSRCRKAKYCSKFCQVFDWRSGRHKRTCISA
mmetsp:Transcript_19854/g.29510  ORF Transcript_19854/g.29510 Transcript_19854/m.29510 type:complete len:374 (-) Transcript_19854:71-1192(-)